MEEAMLPENIERRLTLSFKAVRNDMELLKKQIIIAQEINAVSPSYDELKSEIFMNLDKSLLQYEQKISSMFNEELKKQNKLLQQILEKVKLQDQQEKLQQQQLSGYSKEIKELTEFSLSFKEMKQQFLKMKKQQDVLLNESVDMQDVEKSFMTEKDAMSLLNQKYDENFKRNSIQSNEKIKSLRFDFDELHANLQHIQKALKHDESETKKKNADYEKLKAALETAEKQLSLVSNNVDIFINKLNALNKQLMDNKEQSTAKKEVLKLITEQYQKLNDKNNLQIYDKMSDLRHDFDEIAIYNNQLHKKVKAMEETIVSGNFINKLKMAADDLAKENEQLKQRLSDIEKDIFSLHHRKHKEEDIDIMLNDIARLKQNSMTKDDVQHMLDAFSKKINVMRQELDDFEKNLDAVDLQTKQFHV
ncbi:hypothetical protein HZA96_02460 [Candidatus Woesearchaeota archaeon]|nr:hypothetical protein [Candidatus Woesearchaeota archaeon]